VRTGLTFVAALALAAGCGDDPAPSNNPAAPATTVVAPQSGAATPAAGATSAAASPSPAPSVDKEVVFTVTKRKASPPTSRVEVAKGAAVRITVTSDEPDELHVHGYDLELPLAAGAPGSITLRADRTGLFEVETHKSHLVLFQLVVR
jgi:hypothetical protein